MFLQTILERLSKNNTDKQEIVKILRKSSIDKVYEYKSKEKYNKFIKDMG